MEHNRSKIKELLERKIGGKKNKIDWSLYSVQLQKNLPVERSARQVIPQRTQLLFKSFCREIN